METSDFRFYSLTREIFYVELLLAIIQLPFTQVVLFEKEKIAPPVGSETGV